MLITNLWSSQFEIHDILGTCGVAVPADGRGQDALHRRYDWSCGPSCLIGSWYSTPRHSSHQRSLQQRGRNNIDQDCQAVDGVVTKALTAAFAHSPYYLRWCEPSHDSKSHESSVDLGLEPQYLLSLRSLANLNYVSKWRLGNEAMLLTWLQVVLQAQVT